MDLLPTVKEAFQPLAKRLLAFSTGAIAREHFPNQPVDTKKFYLLIMKLDEQMVIPECVKFQGVIKEVEAELEGLIADSPWADNLKGGMLTEYQYELFDYYQCLERLKLHAGMANGGSMLPPIITLDEKFSPKVYQNLLEPALSTNEVILFFEYFEEQKLIITYDASSKSRLGKLFFMRGDDNVRQKISEGTYRTKKDLESLKLKLQIIVEKISVDVKKLPK